MLTPPMYQLYVPIYVHTFDTIYLKPLRPTLLISSQEASDSSTSTDSSSSIAALARVDRPGHTREPTAGEVACDCASHSVIMPHWQQ